MAGEVGGDLDLSIYPGYEQEGMCRRFYHRHVKVAGIDLSMYRTPDMSQRSVLGILLWQVKLVGIWICPPIPDISWGNVLEIIPVFRIRKIVIRIRIRILGPVSIITDPDPDPTCSPAIVNEHYWSMHHISKLKVPIQKISLPYPVRSAICIFSIKEIRLHIILINNVAKKE